MDKFVRRRHAVPNALLPTITLIFLNLGFTVSGAITVETVFSWPGLGLLSYEALRGPDVALLQAHLPALLHRRRAGQPRRRPALRRDRPASEVVMAERPADPRSRRMGRRAIARARRRAAFGRGWRQFRRHRGGMAGLGILVFFILVALLAPVLFPR